MGTKSVYLKFYILTLIIIGQNLSRCNGLDDVIIDTQDDLTAVGSDSVFCAYVDKLTNTWCKTATDSESSGFWASCVANFCYLTINVGRLGNYGAVPTEFQVVSYVQGITGEIQPMYKLKPGDLFAPNLRPSIRNLRDWATSEPYNLTAITDFNSDSQIILRLFSNPLPGDVAIVDKVIFKFESGTTTTTTTTEISVPTSSPESSTEDSCPSGLYCTATDRFGRNWSACAGKVATMECPKNINEIATWFCQQNGEFEGSTPDYSKCSNEWISDIEKEIDEGLPIPPDRAKTFLNTIADNSKLDGYFGHEIQNILNLTARVLGLVSDEATVNNFETLTENGWTIFGDILTNNEPWKEINEEIRTKAGSEFIQSLETTGLGLSGRAVEDDDSKYRKDFQKFAEFRVLSGARAQAGKPLSFPEEYSDKDSHIDIPSEWSDFIRAENVTFVGVLVKPEYSNFILPGHLNSIDSDKNSSSGKMINGNIMGFSFGDQTVLRFQKYIDMVQNHGDPKPLGINFPGEGVKITFQHDRPAWGDEIAHVRRRLHDGETAKAVIGTSACVYWDTDNLIWSSTGCTPIVSEYGKTICECNHLTSFALLMDVHNYIGKDLGLEILTLVLCPISIICLVICVYIFSTVKSERSPRNELTLNLCVCLLVGNLLMIFLMDKHYLYLSDGVCVASAVVIHYAFLSAMFWMALEGALIFKVLFLDVFGQAKDYLLLQHILAYGIPALIVGATGLTTALRADRGYGNDSFCWLNGGYIWAFLGPTAFILTANLVVLVFSVRKALSVQNRPQPGYPDKGKMSLTWVKGCVSLSVLLGLTWIFGYLMAIDNSTTANISAYIFTILNASQGIFLLIFHGIMNQNVRTALKRKLPARFHSNAGSHGTDAPTNSTDMSLGARVRQSFSSLKNTLLLRRPSEHHSSN